MDDKQKAREFIAKLQSHAFLEMGGFPDLQSEVFKSINNEYYAKESKDHLGQIYSDDMRGFDDFRRSFLAEPDRDHSNKELSLSFFSPELREQLRRLQPNDIASTEVDMTEALRIWETELPTQFENPSYYRIMLIIKQYVEKAIDRLSLNVPSALIGTLPHGDLNAKVTKAPDTDTFVILFQYGFFEYLIEAIALVEQYMRLDKTKNKSVKLDAKIKFAKLTLSYFLDGKLSDEARVHRSLDKSISIGLQVTKINPIMIFAFGHEYGHLINGHLPSKSSLSVKERWEQELEADLRGYQILLNNTQDSFPVIVPVVAVDLFITLLSVLDQSREILINGEIRNTISKSASHPSLLVRRKAFQLLVEHSLPEDISKPIITACGIYGLALMEMSEYLQQQLINAYSDGRRLQAIWTTPIANIFK